MTLGFFGFDMRGADWFAWFYVVFMSLFIALSVPAILIRVFLDVRQWHRDRKAGLY